MEKGKKQNRVGYIEKKVQEHSNLHVVLLRSRALVPTILNFEITRY